MHAGTNREILASCTFTVISTVLSALQSPPLSINLYVMFVTNSLLVSVSSHVNENVTLRRPAFKRLAETAPTIAPAHSTALTAGKAAPSSSKNTVPPVVGVETMSTDVPSTPSSASVPAKDTDAFVPATASTRVTVGTVGVAARAVTINDRNAPTTARTTTAPRPRLRARRTGVIATSRVVTTLSLASRARRASRETTTTTISSASPHSSLSPVSRARAVHRRGALCRERCPRGSSGLVKMDEMNYTTRSRKSALSARTR
tara:strand:- start:5730 stop:6509 length:780 start_codon:yes stop_codon:yes gene_type:complete